jgi:CBS domain containing-hemolysin-like protein
VALSLLAAAALVAANAFFVATEFSLARLRTTQVDDYVRQGRAGAKSARHAVDHIDAYLAACQLGITLASLGLGVVGEPVFEELLHPLFGEGASVAGFAVAGALAFGLITVLHVVVGELAPKSLAIAKTAPVALVLAPLMRAFYMATKPLVDLFNWMGNLLLKPFGIPPAAEAGHAPHSEDELRELLRQSSQEGMIGVEESEYTENVLLFGDRRAREAMTPRPEVDWVSTQDDLRHAAEAAVRTGRTRLPLCEGDAGLDAVVGVVNAKDLLGATVRGEQDMDLRAIARPLARVNEAEHLDEVLREMRRERRHVAVVMDEHGTAIGLLSLEDILETIVGSIEDEYDAEAAEVLRQDGEDWIAAGSAPLREVVARVGLELGDLPHEATIGGHLLEELGRVPSAGETVTVDGRPVEILDADEAQITRLRFPAAVPD